MPDSPNSANYTQWDHTTTLEETFLGIILLITEQNVSSIYIYAVSISGIFLDTGFKPRQALLQLQKFGTAGNDVLQNIWPMQSLKGVGEIGRTVFEGVFNIVSLFFNSMNDLQSFPFNLLYGGNGSIFVTSMNDLIILSAITLSYSGFNFVYAWIRSVSIYVEHSIY